MHPPSEHRQARVRPGHHTDKLEQIRDQLNQSRRLIAPPIDPSPPVETQVDITRNLETLLACGADRGRAIEALSKTSSVAQAAQWLFDTNRSSRPSQSTQQDEYDEPRSSEMPIPSMTHNEGYYNMNAGSDSYYHYAKSRVAPAPPVTPSPSLSSMRPDYYEQYYHQRLMEDNYNSRMSSPSSNAPMQHHSAISTNYSLPMTTSHSSSHSSTVFRSPSPSIASSSSSRLGLSPSKQADYNRTHLKMTLSANSPYATESLLPASPQIGKVQIHKITERESPIYRPSTTNDHREEREAVPVMKARLPTLPSNLSINVKSGGGPVNANISSEDHRYFHYPLGVPSTSSSSVYLNSTSSMDSVNTKVIYHDEIRRPEMRPPPQSEYVPTTNSYRAPSPNLPTYSQAARKPMQSVPIGGSHSSQPLTTTSVFIGRPAYPTATQSQLPGPSTRTVAAPPPPSPNTKRRSLSPLPEDVKNRIRNNTHVRTIESCKPRLFRFFMEQHIERLLEQQKDRTKRADQLRKEMDEAKLAESAKNLLLDHLLQKESRYMRLKRQKMNKDMFEHIKHIGVGAFGRVSLVKKRDTGLVYAMKSLLKKDVISKNQAAHVKAERDILAEADSPWIVRLFFSFQDERCLYFIMEYVPGGDMMELLIKKGWFNEMEARFYISELTVAIDYVHSLGFIHRDIKPDNILIDREGHLKLTDFGLCTGLRWTHDKKYYGLENDDRPGHLREDSLTINTSVNADGSADSGKVKILEARHRKKRDQAHSLVGTTSYMAPEVILRTGHTQLCDWWSVGVILYEMVYGRAPFSSEYDDEEIKSKIVNHRYELKLYKRVPVADGYNTLSDECIMIIRDLCSEQNSRLGKDEGAADVQGHPWFKDVNFDTLRQQTAVWKPQIAHSEDTSNFEPLELAEFPFDSLRAPPPNNPAFYEFTFRHFFDSGGQGSLNRGPQSHRPPFARGAIPFDGVSSSQPQHSQQPQQPQPGRSSQPPPYASATSGQSMTHIREAKMSREFDIHWEVDKVSELNSVNFFSPIVIHANLPWSLLVRKSKVDNIEYFSLFLECNDDSVFPLWSVLHNTKLTLVNRQNSDMNETLEFCDCYGENNVRWGRTQFILFADIIDVGKGFIQDGKVLIEAHISIDAVHGIKEVVNFDFSQPDEASDNIILTVEREKFYVSKGYLATQSPYFAALFNGKFKEKKQSEIELKDVTASEFSEFLHIAYPSNKAVTVHSYKSVLVLADRFRVQCAMDKVEKYLINTKKVAIEVKLQMADQYRLEELKMYCLNSLETTEAVKAIEKTREFKKYSGAMNTLLLKRVLALIK